MTDQDDSGMSLTPGEVARSVVSIDWLTGASGGLMWVASGAASALQSWSPDSGTLVEHSLPGVSVGSSLHAYGGLPYAVGPASSWLIDFRDGQVWEGAKRLTHTAHAYGDLFYVGGQLWCVREGEAGDELIVIDPARVAEPVVMRRTDGFLSTPRPHGGVVAWVAWAPTVMPWDSSEVWVADYGRGGLTDSRRVAGGPAESATQPQWGQDGHLYFMSDRSGWWNLYRWRAGLVEAVAPVSADCATAPWESSYNNYAFLPDGRIALTVHNGPGQVLNVVDPGGTTSQVALPYTSIKPFLAACEDGVALIGSSPTCSQEIALVPTVGPGRIQVVRRGSEPPTGGEISVPQVLRIDSAGSLVTVLYYPPTGRSGPAPLIVRPHAGPTYHSEFRLDLEVQFFTSRGYGVADVDYRGSTGYGRTFRKALDGNWGRFDVQDCRNAAEHLVVAGRAMPGAVFISGASAGGYTALRAACEDGPFAVAVARSAIVDPRRWITTAPRFQRPHAAIMSHDSSMVDPSRLRRPILLVHGREDPIAPIDDVIELAGAAAERGLLIDMVSIDGVGHNFSSPAALVTALGAELDAYDAVLKGSATPS